METAVPRRSSGRGRPAPVPARAEPSAEYAVVDETTEADDDAFAEVYTEGELEARRQFAMLTLKDEAAIRSHVDKEDSPELVVGAELAEVVGEAPPPPPAGETRIMVVAMAKPEPRLTVARKSVGRSVRSRTLKTRGLDSFFGQSVGGGAVQSFAPAQKGAEPADAPGETPPEPLLPKTAVITDETSAPEEWQLGPNDSVYVRRVAAATGDPQSWQWRVSASNTGYEPTKVLFTREFPTTNWTIEVSNEAALTLRDSRRAEISIDVPPRSERSFTYSIRSPVPTEQ